MSPVTAGLIGTALTGFIGLLGIWWTRKGQEEVDSGKLALEIARETREEVKELKAERQWYMGALSIYVEHIDLLRSWINEGREPPPPPRPVLPPGPTGVRP